MRFSSSSLDVSQFGHAMFQLIDEWCGGASSTDMIAAWLRILFGNLVQNGGFKPLADVRYIEDELNSMILYHQGEDERKQVEYAKSFKEQRKADAQKARGRKKESQKEVQAAATKIQKVHRGRTERRTKGGGGKGGGGRGSRGVGSATLMWRVT